MAPIEATEAFLAREEKWRSFLALLEEQARKTCFPQAEGDAEAQPVAAGLAHASPLDGLLSSLGLLNVCHWVADARDPALTGIFVRALASSAHACRREAAAGHLIAFGAAGQLIEEGEDYGAIESLVHAASPAAALLLVDAVLRRRTLPLELLERVLYVAASADDEDVRWRVAQGYVERAREGSLLPAHIDMALNLVSAPDARSDFNRAWAGLRAHPDFAQALDACEPNQRVSLLASAARSKGHAYFFLLDRFGLGDAQRRPQAVESLLSQLDAFLVPQWVKMACVLPRLAPCLLEPLFGSKAGLLRDGLERPAAGDLAQMLESCRVVSPGCLRAMAAAILDSEPALEAVDGASSREMCRIVNCLAQAELTRPEDQARAKRLEPLLPRAAIAAMELAADGDDAMGLRAACRGVGLLGDADMAGRLVQLGARHAGRALLAAARCDLSLLSDMTGGLIAHAGSAQEPRTSHLDALASGAADSVALACLFTAFARLPDRQRARDALACFFKGDRLMFRQALTNAAPSHLAVLVSACMETASPRLIDLFEEICGTAHLEARMASAPAEVLAILVQAAEPALRESRRRAAMSEPLNRLVHLEAHVSGWRRILQHRAAAALVAPRLGRKPGAPGLPRPDAVDLRAQYRRIVEERAPRVIAQRDRRESALTQ